MSNDSQEKKEKEKVDMSKATSSQKKEETKEKSITTDVEISHPPLPEEGKAELPKEVITDQKTSPNIVYIGKKPVMSYAMSSLIQLTHSGEITLKARGLLVSRAVDVAEIVTKRLGNNAFSVKNIKIDTEKLGSGDDIRSVSTIEIAIGKK